MRFLRRYLAYVRMTLFVWSAYRMNVFLWFFMELSRIVVLYFLWGAVYAGCPGGVLAGYTLPEMIGYVFISVFVYSYTSGDTVHLVSRRITEGTIALDLTRPVDFQTVYFFSDLGGKAVLLVANLAALLLAVHAFAIPHPAGAGWTLFGLSLFLAGCLHFYLDFIVSLLAFYVTNLWGIFIASESVFEFFSGAVIPLAFFPPALRAVADGLPFASIVFAPVNLFLGKLSPAETRHALLLQAAWTFALFAAGRLLFSVAVRRVTIHGG